jgi:DNA-binding SARP family transcriptional activator
MQYPLISSRNMISTSFGEEKHGPMEFNVMGGLTLTRAGRQVRLGGVVKRKVLSLLLLHANQTVSTNQLLSSLWPGEHPATARKMLQNAVSDLRRVLGEWQTGEEMPLLVTHPPGYFLRVAPAQVDLLRFRQAAALGLSKLETKSYHEASEMLRFALSLYRGPVLSDLLGEDRTWPEIEAAEELVMNVREDYFDAELALGHHRAVLEELQSLHMARLSRERVCLQLMLALYRCGRQSDALAAYQRTRSSLVSESGLEPHRDLRALQSAILSQDDGFIEGLSGQVGTAADSLSPSPGSPTARSRKAVAVVAFKLHVVPWEGERINEEVAELTEKAAAEIHRELEKHKGDVQLELGSLSVAVFCSTGSDDDPAEHAVRAGIEIHHRFNSGTVVGSVGNLYAVRTSVVVSAGNTAVRKRTSDRQTIQLTVSGSVMDQCWELLQQLPSGEIRICEDP